jgi:hypothetical protein
MDVSYSMQQYSEKIVSGLNKFLINLKQRVDHQNILLSVMLFSDKRSYLCRGVPVDLLHPFQKSDIGGFGMTHLYDAIGVILTEWINENRLQHHLYIITDGADNGSKNINKEQAKLYCTEAVKQGWAITHCDVDASNLQCDAVKEVRYEVDELDQLLGRLSL